MAPADPSAGVDAEPSTGGAYECARAAVCRVLELPPGRVLPTHRLAADLGADSLAIVEIAELAEDEAMRRWRVRAHVDDLSLTMTCTVGELAEELWRSLSGRSLAGHSLTGRLTAGRSVAERTLLWRTVPRARRPRREGGR